MKLIIVPTDFSPVADNAIKYAVDMAEAINAKIMLLNAYQIPISYTEVPLASMSLDQLQELSHEKLKETKKHIDTITGGKIHVYTETKLGDVSEEVEKLCETLDPFAIVIGTRGVTGVGRFFMGSNTLSILKKVDTPVFVIPPGVSFKKFTKVGLATDMHDVVESTPVEPIKQIINTFNAELHVLNVDFERRNFSPATPEETLNLDTMLAGMNPVYDFIENKDVDQGLNDFAERNNIDLLITLPKKHSFLEKIFEKSHTRELIHETNIPLLCLQMKKAEVVG